MAVNAMIAYPRSKPLAIPQLISQDKLPFCSFALRSQYWRKKFSGNESFNHCHAGEVQTRQKLISRRRTKEFKRSDEASVNNFVVPIIWKRNDDNKRNLTHENCRTTHPKFRKILSASSAVY